MAFDTPFDPDDDRCKNGDCSTGETCYRHKLRSMQISPSATPTRRNAIPSQVTIRNSWERGTVKDERGMPLLNAKGDPVGVKEMADNRHKYEARIRELKNTPPTTPVTSS